MSRKLSDVNRSRTRTGADEVRAWVRRLHLDNPYAKAILMAAANYANENAAAWPGLVTLGADTDIAQNTVIARLNWCQQIGAIDLIKTWIDENGNRNYLERGRITSTEIRFLIDVDPEVIATNARQSAPRKVARGFARKKGAERTSETAVCSSSHEERELPLDYEQTPIGTSVAHQQHISSSSPHEPEGRRKKEEYSEETYVSSAASAPSTPLYTDSRHELFGEGTLILVSLGVEQRKARSMIGRWLKDMRDDAQHVLGAIQRARDHRIIDPIPWITQSLKVRENVSAQNNTAKPGSFFAGIAKVAANLDRDGAVAGSTEEDIPLGRVNIDG